MALDESTNKYYALSLTGELAYLKVMSYFNRYNELWCWRRLLRVPWTARRCNQTILKEINPEYSFEGLMLRLKLQYFRHVCVPSHFSCGRPFVTPGNISRQAPLSMGFSRQEDWSELPCPSPGDLPDPGIEPVSLTSPALAGGFFTTSTTWEAP